MISIRESLAELEQCYRARAVAVESYVNAIQSMAQYAIELDPAISQPHRDYLTALTAEVAAGGDGVLEESRASLRGLLRDYREKATQYLANLHGELSSNARALEEIMETLAMADGDHGGNVRAAIERLREVASLSDASVVRAVVQSAAANLETALQEMQSHHRLTVSQFQVEIRMLHKRIDSLEKAASIDTMTKLFNRAQMEEQIESMDPEASILVIRVNGLRRAETSYQGGVIEELAGAFSKRLRNCLPPGAVIGRWGYEEFVAIVPADNAEALTAARWIAEHLSGAYACMHNGKTVRPSLQLSVGVVEHGGESPEQRIERVRAFFGVG